MSGHVGKLTGIFLALLVSPIPVSSTAAATAQPAIAPLAHRVIFEFHSAFLMNLHSFLLDAAIRKPELASYPWVEKPRGADLKALTDAIAFYEDHYAQRNLLFDHDMTFIKKSLSVEDARRQVKGLNLPPDLTVVLENVVPVYARCLWPEHDRSNLEWIRQVEALNKVYGADIQERIEHYMAHPFPLTPIREDIVVLTGQRNGAYTDTQTVLPSGPAS